MTDHDDSEAHAAVQGYLLAEFPGADLWDQPDVDASAHTWGVVERHVPLLLTLTLDLLRDREPGAILARFDDWRVADQLRASGATRRVLVTKDGVQVVAR